MRVVLDTNVFISGIFWKGYPYTVLELWAEKKLTVLVTPEIVQEYYGLLQRMDPASTIAKQWMMFIVEHTAVVASSHEIRICRDPFDDMFINCAVVGKAKYIISGDKDLLSLKRVFGIPIVKPRQFLSMRA